MIKYGFEKEFFVQDTHGNFILTPKGLSMDECGYLAECRSLPYHLPLEAVFLLHASIYKLEQDANTLGVKLIDIPYTKLTKPLLVKALRTYGKPSVPNERGNIYGLEYSPYDSIQRAGVHIHFSNSKTIEGKDRNIEVPIPMDIPKIVQQLDKAFRVEIKEANRKPGFYETKDGLHGGFEYRSLPSNINLDKLIEVLSRIQL